MSFLTRSHKHNTHDARNSPTNRSRRLAIRSIRHQQQTAMPNADPEDAHDSSMEMEMLARRLARLEAQVLGDTARSGPSIASSMADLRKRLRTAAARVVDAGEQVGEAGARLQLEREMLLSSSSSSSVGAGWGGLSALAPPPPLIGLEEKAAVLLAQEGELRGVLDGLERVGRLRKCADDPWPSLGGGGANRAKEAAALKRRLAALEARFWDAEAVAAALARELDEVLTAYDDVVAMLSRRCVQWEALLAAHARRRENENMGR